MPSTVPTANFLRKISYINTHESYNKALYRQKQTLFFPPPVGPYKDSVDALDWPSLARDRQTSALYMAVRRFQEIHDKLIEYGRSSETPIEIIENGTGAKLEGHTRLSRKPDRACRAT